MPTETWWNLPDDKRRRVLDKALEEFGRRGYAAGSLNVIARDAHVAKGSLFQYFADKLDLWTAVVDDASQRTAEHLVVGMERRGEQPFFEQFRGVASDWVELLGRDVLIRNGILALVREVDESARRVGRASTNEHFESLLAAPMKLAVERGDLRPGADPTLVLWQAISLLRHLAVATHLPGEDPSLDLEQITPRAFRRRLDAVLDAFERAWTAQENR